LYHGSDLFCPLGSLRKRSFRKLSPSVINQQKTKAMEEKEKEKYGKEEC
jgi:hypothetical protein